MRKKIPPFLWTRGILFGLSEQGRGAEQKTPELAFRGKLRFKRIGKNYFAPAI